MNFINWVKNNVDKKLVLNGVVSAVVVGGIIYGAKKSGIGIAKKAAVVAQGGGK